MFLPLGGSSVILFPAHSRTLDRAFSSGGERFPDTEEVTSSNLVTPTKCSQLRGFASELFCFTPTSQEGAATPKAASTTSAITPPTVPKATSTAPATIPTKFQAASATPATTPARFATASTLPTAVPTEPKVASATPGANLTKPKVVQTALPTTPHRSG